MSSAEIHRWCLGVVVDTGKHPRKKSMAWGILISGKLTSADFSLQLLNTPFGLGLESHLQSLSIE